MNWFWPPVTGTSATLTVWSLRPGDHRAIRCAGWCLRSWLQPAALSDALTYCDKAYSAMTDAHAADLVKFFGRDQPKLAILAFNSAHNMEHYGNLVTYMRIKGLVPPSSEPRK
jgi:hypothetical protein